MFTKYIISNKFFIYLFTVVFLGAFVLSGCDPIFRYEGEYTDLASTAIFSIPGVESSSNDQFLLLEEDQYGRKLFAAILERSQLIRHSFNDCVMAVIVMQDSDNTHTYFYSEQNYLLTLLSSKEMKLSEYLVGQFFTDDSISDLKEQNDWGRNPITCSQSFAAAPLTVEKDYVISRQSESLIANTVGTNYRYSFFRSTESGNVFFVLNIPRGSSTYEWYLVLFDQSGSFPASGSYLAKLDTSKLDALSEAVKVFLEGTND